MRRVVVRSEGDCSGVTASQERAKQSHERRLGLPRRYALCNDISYGIAALPLVARNDWQHLLRYY